MRSPKDVTEAEMSVLQLLWTHGMRSVREMSDELYPGGGNSEAATVQKLCERLIAKGLVESDRRRRPHQYSASVDRDSLLGRRLQAMADQFCSGSVAPLVTQLIRGGSFSADEIAALREEVARLEEGPSPPTRRRKKR